MVWKIHKVNAILWLSSKKFRLYSILKKNGKIIALITYTGDMMVKKKEEMKSFRYIYEEGLR